MENKYFLNTSKILSAAVLASVFSIGHAAYAVTGSINYSTSTPVKSGTTLTITANFSNDMAALPVPQISIDLSGTGNVLPATDMVITNATTYSYDYVVGAGDGVATVSFATGTDILLDALISVPITGETFIIDNTAPTVLESKILGPNLLRVRYSESVNTSVSDYSSLRLIGASTTPSITGISGNGTSVIDIAFDGASTTPSETGLIDILGTVTDIAGNTLLPLIDYAISDGQNPSAVIVTSISSLISTTTPVFDIFSDEAGSISFIGGCSTSVPLISVGTTTVLLDALVDDAYSCDISVTDIAGNVGTTTLPPFTVDTTALQPVVSMNDPINFVSQTSFGFLGTAENLSVLNYSITDSASTTPTTGTTTVSALGTFVVSGLDISTFTDGEIVGTFSIQDQAGNISASAIATSTKETSIPVVVEDVPVASLVNTNTPSFGISSNENGTLDFIGGGNCSLLTVASSSISVGTTTMAFLPLVDGTYVCGISVTDIYGNTGTTSLTQFTVDTIANAPVVALTNPINATNSSGVSFIMTGESDSNVLYNIYNSGDSLLAISGTSTISSLGNLSVSGLDMSTFADGTIVGEFSIVDLAGNVSATTTINAFKDTVVPIVTNVSLLPSLSNINDHAFSLNTTEAGTISFTGSSGCSVLTLSSMTAGVGTTTTSFTTMSDGDYNCSVNVTDIYGNIGTASMTPFTVDTSAFAPMVAFGTVNISNQSNVSIVGLGENASTIFYSISSGTTTPITGTTTADVLGVWSLTGIDFSSFDDGTLTGLFSIVDLAGNASATTTATATKDTVAPVISNVTELSALSNINNPAFSIDSTEAGTISFTGGVNCSSLSLLSMAAGVGTTTTSFTAIPDGTYNCSVDITDTAGNTGTYAMNAFSVDTVADAPVAVMNPVNLSNQASYQVNGTAEPLSLVFYSFTSGTSTPIMGTTTVSALGSFATTFSSLSLFEDGAVSGSFSMVDLAGNVSATSTVGTIKDIVVPVVAEVSPVAPTPTNNTTPTYSFSSTKAGAGSYANGCIASTTSILVGTTTISFNALADGTYACGVVVTDDAGNQGSLVSTSFTIDTVALTPTSTIPVINDINKNAVTISGGAEALSTVMMSITDSVTTVNSTTVANALGVWTNTIDLSSLADGTITGMFSIVDLAGNTSATSTATTTKDTIIPIITNSVVVPSPTNNTTPSYTFSSTEAGNISVSGGCTTSTLSAGVGTTTISIDALADGTYNCTITLTDSSGNISTVFSVPTFVIDTVALAPSASVPVVNSSNQNSITVSGSAEALSTVYVNVSSATTSVATTTTVNGAGIWSTIFDMSSLLDGTLTGLFSIVDLAGNASATTTATATKDTVAPVISNVTELSALSNINNPAFSIDSTEAGTISFTGGVNCSSLSLLSMAAGVGTTTTSFTAIPDGTYNCSVDITDTAGNTGTYAMNAFSVDTVADAPVLTGTLPLISSSNITSVGASGTAEALSVVLVSVSDGMGNVSATTTVDALGNWTKTFDLSSLLDGLITGSFSIIDLAGNVSATTTATTTKDTTPPVLSEIIAVSSPTNNTTPLYTFSSTEAGILTLSGGCSSATTNILVGTTTISFNLLVDGTYNCQATTTDMFGNISTTLSISAFTIDTFASAPTSTIPQISASNQNAVSVSGIGEQQATVLMTISDSTATTTISATTTVSLLGAWNTFVDLSSLTDGLITGMFSVIDLAGNVSATSTATSTKDTIAPVLIEVTPVSLRTNDTTPVYIFASNESGTISIIGGCSTSTGFAGVGTTTITLNALVDGTYSCTLNIADGFGNTSTGLNMSTFTVDTIASAPTSTIPVINDINKNAVTISGGAEALSTVMMSITDSVTTVNSTTVANALGVWTNTIDLSSLADGTITGMFSIVDLAGNTSATSTATTTKSTTIVVAPEVAQPTPSNGPIVGTLIGLFNPALISSGNAPSTSVVNNSTSSGVNNGSSNSQGNTTGVGLGNNSPVALGQNNINENVNTNNNPDNTTQVNDGNKDVNENTNNGVQPKLADKGTIKIENQAASAGSTGGSFGGALAIFVKLVLLGSVAGLAYVSLRGLSFSGSASDTPDNKDGTI